MTETRNVGYASTHLRSIATRVAAATKLGQRPDPDTGWLVGYATSLEQELTALRAEVTRLELAAVRVVQRADGMVAHHCGDAVNQTFCEEYGCGTLVELVEPLRAATGEGSGG